MQSCFYQVLKSLKNNKFFNVTIQQVSKHICISSHIFLFSQDLVEDQVPTFVEKLNMVVQEETAEVKNSSGTIAAIVQILNNVVNISTAVNEAVAQVGCLSTDCDALH